MVGIYHLALFLLFFKYLFKIPGIISLYFLIYVILIVYYVRCHMFHFFSAQLVKLRVVWDVRMPMIGCY